MAPVSTSERKIACSRDTVELWSRDTLGRPQWLEINGKQQAAQVYRDRLADRGRSLLYDVFVPHTSRESLGCGWDIGIEDRKIK